MGADEQVVAVVALGLTLRLRARGDAAAVLRLPASAALAETVATVAQRRRPVDVTGATPGG